MYTLASLALAACAITIGGPPDDEVIFKTGTVVVKRQRDYVPKGSQLQLQHLVLLRRGINRGTNYLKPANPADYGNPKRDFSRKATTYHHRRGPFGVVMERFNWFPDPNSNNTFWADARLPASLVGLGVQPLHYGSLPVEQLVGLWSEPPFAVIGMYVGDEASYARPFQWVDFYESDPRIVKLSVPDKGDPYFWYVHDARKRGARVNILRGPERRTLAARGPQGFYQVIVVEICTRDQLEDIAIDLMTREGLSLLFDKLAEEGIVCYHVSNRYVNVVPLIADVAKSLGYSCRHGHDMSSSWQNPDGDRSHYTSDWVMVARTSKYLDHLKEPPGYTEELKNGPVSLPKPEPYWTTPEARGKYAWKDRSKHSVRGLIRIGSDAFTSRLDTFLGNVLADYLVYQNQKAGRDLFSPRVIGSVRYSRLFDGLFGSTISSWRDRTDQTFGAYVGATAKKE